VSETWIVNASPLITMAKVGYLQIFEQLASEILIPEPVAQEILAAAPSDPARKALESGWGKITFLKEVPPAILEWGLGKGESGVLALAAERPGCTVVLDDAAARRSARALDIPLIGTLGAVLRARQMGLVDSAGQVLTALRAAGLRLDEETIRTSLERIGETWPAS
jgi:predicted nucleic acid-binding protein